MFANRVFELHMRETCDAIRELVEKEGVKIVEQKV